MRIFVNFKVSLFRCFVQLVNGLRVNREGSEDYNQFSKVFPDFLWLLRDVTLTPTDAKGNTIAARTFLLVNKERQGNC